MYLVLVRVLSSSNSYGFLARLEQPCDLTLSSYLEAAVIVIQTSHYLLTIKPHLNQASTTQLDISQETAVLMIFAT